MTSLDLKLRFDPLEWKSMPTGKDVDKAVLRGARSTARAMRRDLAAGVYKARGLKKRFINDALKVIAPRTRGRKTIFGVLAAGKRVALSKYQHSQQKRGVKVQVTRGQPKLIPGAFVTSMRVPLAAGIFRRVGKARLPIKELYGPTVADAARVDEVNKPILDDATAAFVLVMGEILGRRKKQ